MTAAAASCTMMPTERALTSKSYLLSWIITIRQASLQVISWCCEKLKAVDRTQVNSAARPICPGGLTTLVLGFLRRPAASYFRHPADQISCDDEVRHMLAGFGFDIQRGNACLGSLFKATFDQFSNGGADIIASAVRTNVEIYPVSDKLARRSIGRGGHVIARTCPCAGHFRGFSEPSRRLRPAGGPSEPAKFVLTNPLGDPGAVMATSRENRLHFGADA